MESGGVLGYREGHQSPATQGKEKGAISPSALVRRSGFGCPAELRKWDGMAQKGPFWEHK